MEIKELGNEEVEYRKLKISDCFIHVTNDVVYMKLPQGLDEFKMPINQAANLKYGCIAHFKNHTKVIPVEATLTIKKLPKNCKES